MSNRSPSTMIDRQFKSNASATKTSLHRTATDVAALCHPSYREVRETLMTLKFHGVVTFETKNAADAGGKTLIAVQRVG